MSSGYLTFQPFAAFQGSEILQQYYDELEVVLKTYLDPQDIEKVLECAIYGARAHDGQKRKSGEPYFVHPISVCGILAKQGFEVPVLQAALLHDVLEDTAVTKADMAQAFGGEVTRMVDGVSKLDELREKGVEIMQAETFKKMLVATADDPRVLVIKLADRLHNMSTLDSFRRDKQRRISRETLNIYASIAGRLGLFYFRTKLEDLAFRYLYPWRYAVLKKYYEMYCQNTTELESVREHLQPTFESLEIKASINKRQRHLWGLYQRMLRKKEQHKDEKGKKQGFTNACRTILMRIITDSEDNCYRVLGRVHAAFRPVKNKFEDFIAAPKSNGYRSLHTGVLTENGNVLNIQIRTRDMHTLAEMGIISVWHQYEKKRAVQLEEHSFTAAKGMKQWLSRLKEVQNISSDPLEFYESVKSELLMTSSDMYVYTPKGKVIDLPIGSTAVDFAYALSDELGDYCLSAEVNNRPFPIYKPLTKGQTVHIITAETPRVHAGWLQFAVSPTARGQIKRFLREMAEEQARDLGLTLINTALERLGRKPITSESIELQQYLHARNLTETELLIQIGRGQRQAALVASALLGKQVNICDNDGNRILEVISAHDSGLSMANCCYPLPKEEIIGQIVPDKGIIIHSEHCSFSQVGDREEIIPAMWSKKTQGDFLVKLELEVGDRQGLLAEISAKLSQAGINIVDLEPGKNSGDGQPRKMSFVISVRDGEHLTEIQTQLSMIDKVNKVQRN